MKPQLTCGVAESRPQVWAAGVGALGNKALFAERRRWVRGQLCDVLCPQLGMPVTCSGYSQMQPFGSFTLASVLMGPCVNSIEHHPGGVVWWRSCLRQAGQALALVTPTPTIREGRASVSVRMETQVLDNIRVAVLLRGSQLWAAPGPGALGT